MFGRTLPLLLLLLVASVILADSSSRSSRRHGRRHRDPRVYDARPSDIEHDEDDDDENGDDGDDDDEDDDDHHEGGRRRGGGHHDDEHEHDPSYDHEAFLGREESRRFDGLASSEAKNLLLQLLPKLDTNNDTKVSMDEMRAWLATVAKHERSQAAERRFRAIKEFNHALDSVNAPLTLEEYKKAIHHDLVGPDHNDKKALEAFNAQMVRDQARWAKADLNGDNRLSKAEFADFLRPEEAPRMKDVVIQETMMGADKNKDGKIDLNEFMSDLHPTYEADVKEKKKLPRWIEREEKRFKEKLDTNKDGALDPSEIYKWIVPEDFDHSRRETEHLFKLADKDLDKQLSREEMLNKWDIFVGHRAGEGGYSHEEL